MGNTSNTNNKTDTNANSDTRNENAKEILASSMTSVDTQEDKKSISVYITASLTNTSKSCMFLALTYFFLIVAVVAEFLWPTKTPESSLNIVYALAGVAAFFALSHM